MKILLAGGGTAGHINPAIAIANHAKKIDKSTEILFVGKEGNMEEGLVAKAGYDMKFIDIEGIKRRFTFENIRVVVKAFRAVGDCKRIIRQFAPDVVICTGGYVSGPVMYAAHVLYKPSVIHEQNVFPGFTVKLSAGFAGAIATSFEETKQYLSRPSKCVFTGNPLREDILTTERASAREALGLDERPFLLAFGGSLGAQRLNQAIIGYLAMAAKEGNFQLLFGTGSRNYDEVMKGIADANINLKSCPNIKIEPYIYNMNEAMAAADIVISRAGAITISEITALGKAAILIPSPNVAHNHQETNAQLLEQHNAALVLREEELTPQALGQTIDTLLSDTALCSSIATNAKTLGITDATEKIVELARQLCTK